MRIVRCEKCGQERWIVNELPYDWVERGDAFYCKECDEAGAKRFLKFLLKGESK